MLHSIEYHLSFTRCLGIVNSFSGEVTKQFIYFRNEKRLIIDSDCSVRDGSVLMEAEIGNVRNVVLVRNTDCKSLVFFRPTPSVLLYYSSKGCHSL